MTRNQLRKIWEAEAKQAWADLEENLDGIDERAHVAYGISPSELNQIQRSVLMELQKKIEKRLRG